MSPDFWLGVTVATGAWVALAGLTVLTFSLVVQRVAQRDGGQD